MKYCLHIQNRFEPIVCCQHPLFDMGTNQLLFVFRKYPCILTGRVWGKSNQEVWLVVVLNSFSTNQLGRKLHRCLCKSCKLFLNKSGSSNFEKTSPILLEPNFQQIVHICILLGSSYLITQFYLCNIQHTMQFPLKPVWVFSHQTQAKNMEGKLKEMHLHTFERTLSCSLLSLMFSRP